MCRCSTSAGLAVAEEWLLLWLLLRFELKMWWVAAGEAAPPAAAGGGGAAAAGEAPVLLPLRLLQKLHLLLKLH